MKYNLADLPGVASQVADSIKGRKVVAFHGEMGSGKTTIISAICHSLGTADVTGSPTFSLINQYNAAGGSIIYHMDWYRLKDEDEAIDAGIEDALYSGNLCLVEWPEKAAGLLPEDCLHVFVTATGPGERIVSFNEPNL